jgi:hypothetical protein
VWCGDTFIGTIGRVRQHHVKDPTVAHTYRLCSSKAPAREAFQANLKAPCTQGAPPHSTHSVARGPYLNHSQGHKIDIHRCVLDRGRPLDPRASCPIPHIGDADDGGFFFSDTPLKKPLQMGRVQWHTALGSYKVPSEPRKMGNKAPSPLFSIRWGPLRIDHSRARVHSQTC